MRVRGLFSQNTQEQYEANQWFRKLLSIGEEWLGPGEQPWTRQGAAGQPHRPSTDHLQLLRSWGVACQLCWWCPMDRTLLVAQPGLTGSSSRLPPLCSARVGFCLHH
jgi:hypothetical protein